MAHAIALTPKRGILQMLKYFSLIISEKECGNKCTFRIPGSVTNIHETQTRGRALKRGLLLCYASIIELNSPS